MKMMITMTEPFINAMFLTHMTGLSRRRVFFSEAELTRVKNAATPLPGSGGDGWVTTQEAIVAYMLQILGKTLLPQGSTGKCLVKFILDARKNLGLPANQSMGSGMNFVNVPVENVLQLSLPEIASNIHEALLTGVASPERQRKQWRLLAGAAERNLDRAVMAELHARQDCDLVLMINNQSKRELPDFGAAGRAERVMTNAGPTLFLPGKGGMEVYIDPAVFESAGHSASGTAASQALAALREELPKDSTFPPVLLASSKNHVADSVAGKQSKRHQAV